MKENKYFITDRVFGVYFKHKASLEWYTRKHYTKGNVKEITGDELKNSKYKHWRMFDITKHNF
jgi:hypothetical protein